MSTAPITPQFIADHLALDYLNTRYGVGDAHQDCLGCDTEVLAWLQLAGLPAAAQVQAPAGSLLQAAHALRDTAYELVRKRQTGVRGDPAVLNQFLSLGNAYQELTWSKAAEPLCTWHHRVECIEALLVPVAQAVATLVAQADFSLVHQCEAPDCTLWFYDRTKSHRRRWCSMAQCGNRMKVAAFRARQKTS